MFPTMDIYVILALAIFSVTSGLLLPMTKPDGSADIDIILSHVTLLEKTVTLFQTKTTHLETELQSTKADLRDHQSRSAAEVTTLRDELATVKGELVIKSNEILSLKSDVATLKTNYLSPKPSINMTIIDSISHDVKSNMADISLLQTDIKSVTPTLLEMNSTVEASITEVKNVVDNCCNAYNTLLKEQKEIKTKVSDMSSALTDVQKNVSAAYSGISHVTDNLVTVQTQLIKDVIDISRVKSDFSTIRQNISGIEISTERNSLSLGNISKILASLTRPVAFHVLLDKHAPIKARQPLKFNVAKYNAANGYSTTSGKFTAPTAGTYLFSTNVVLYQAKTAQLTDISILVSGSSDFLSSGFIETDTNRDSGTLSVSVISYLNQGEEAWVESSFDVDVYGTVSGTVAFNGVLLSPY